MGATPKAFPSRAAWLPSTPPSLDQRQLKQKGMARRRGAAWREERSRAWCVVCVGVGWVGCLSVTSVGGLIFRESRHDPARRQISAEGASGTAGKSWEYQGNVPNLSVVGGLFWSKTHAAIPLVLPVTVRVSNNVKITREPDQTCNIALGPRWFHFAGAPRAYWSACQAPAQRLCPQLRPHVPPWLHCRAAARAHRARSH